MDLLRNQRGSLAITGLLVMLVTLIIVGGVAPYVTTELRAMRQNTDVVEAQYVAEAGIKRALVGFMQGRADWAWADGETRNSFEDNSNKIYTVTITPAIANGTVPPTGTYTIASTGRIGDVSKVSRCQVRIAAGNNGGGANEALGQSDVFSRYVVYDLNKFYVYGGSYPIIDGQMGLAGIDTGIDYVNQFLYNMVFGTIEKPSGWRGSSDWLLTNKLYTKLATAKDIGTLKIIMPTMPQMPAIPASQPNGAVLISAPGNFSGLSYYTNSGLTFGGELRLTNSAATIYLLNGDLKLTNQGSYGNGTIINDNGDIVLYVNGDIDMTSASYISARGNITIYATGQIDLSKKSYIRSETGNITIMAQKDIDLNDNDNYIQAPNNREVKVYSTTGSINFDQSGCYIDGGVVTLHAYNAIKLTNAGSINNNPGYDTAIALLYSANSTTTNSFTIGGAAALFLTSNKFDINNTFNAPRTIFVSSSGESQISGAPKLAGFYTNGSLLISEKPTIVYSTDVMNALGLTGTNGTPTVTIENWSK